MLYIGAFLSGGNLVGYELIVVAQRGSWFHQGRIPRVYRAPCFGGAGLTATKQRVDWIQMLMGCRHRGHSNN
jgi:hypothetical protein